MRSNPKWSFLSTMEDEELERCMICFEYCNPDHAEIASISCGGCGDQFCHMHCLIKRTSRKQRTNMERGIITPFGPRCPRVLISGICSKPLTGLKIVKDKHVPGYSKAPEKPMEGQNVPDAFVLVCRNVPAYVADDVIERYFKQYGPVVRCILVSQESGDDLEAYITFERKDSLEKALSESHTFDGENKLETESLFNNGRAESKNNKNSILISENCVRVGPLPAELTDIALQRYFESFGSVILVKIPGSRKGLGFVYFEDKYSADFASSEQAHVIDGCPVTVSRAKEAIQINQNDNNKVNGTSAWKAVQRANAPVAPTEDPFSEGKVFSHTAPRPLDSVPATPASNFKFDRQSHIVGDHIRRAITHACEGQSEEREDDEGDDDLLKAICASLLDAHSDDDGFGCSSAHQREVQSAQHHDGDVVDEEEDITIDPIEQLERRLVTEMKEAGLEDVPEERLLALLRTNAHDTARAVNAYFDGDCADVGAIVDAAAYRDAALNSHECGGDGGVGSQMRRPTQTPAKSYQPLSAVTQAATPDGARLEAGLCCSAENGIGGPAAVNLAAAGTVTSALPASPADGSVGGGLTASGGGGPLDREEEELLHLLLGKE